MFNLGEVQELEIVKEVEFGVYLSEVGQEGLEEDRILLPRKQVPEGAQKGDLLSVFIYKDSEDRPIATLNEPKIKLGEYKVLTVVAVNQVGAFLDWGLEKDLFLPYKEQVGRVQEGEQVLVRLYTDKSERLCASMEGLYHMLRQDSPYKKDDMVKGRVYEFSDNFGTFVAVDDTFSAMIPSYEDNSNLRAGDIVTVRVVEVKEDGKLTVSTREKAYLQMDVDAKKMLDLIESFDGTLPFTDKSSAELIKRETGLSKNAFKRAIGCLYKKRLIELNTTSIQLAKENKKTV